MAFFEMTSTVLKSLFSRPATKRYPFVKRLNYERTKGGIKIDIENCIFCGICSKKCPADAITVSRTEKFWQIERMKCAVCEWCIDVCPKKCLSSVSEYTAPSAERIVEVFRNA